MVSCADGPFVAGAVGPGIRIRVRRTRAAQQGPGADVDPAHLSPASHAPARGGPLSGSDGAIAGRSTAGPGRALAQQALDRPADDGMMLVWVRDVVSPATTNKSGASRACETPESFG